MAPEMEIRTLFCVGERIVSREMEIRTLIGVVESNVAP